MTVEAALIAGIGGLAAAVIALWRDKNRREDKYAELLLKITEGMTVMKSAIDLLRSEIKHR